MPDAFFHTPARSYTAVERPNCATCGTRMSLARISGRLAGPELRTFECSKCGYILRVVVEAD
jgi:tRNA(Ile2) C34 agmatinyltransferase TiaS